MTARTPDQRARHDCSAGTRQRTCCRGRLETRGSPDVGWVRVVMDSVTGDVLTVASRPDPAWKVF
jgi:hypothetical protein